MSVEDIVDRARGKLHMICIGVGKAGCTITSALKEGDLGAELGQVVPIVVGSSPIDFLYVNQEILPKDSDWVVVGSSFPSVYYKGIGGNTKLGRRVMISDYDLIINKVLEKKAKFDQYGVPLDTTIIIMGVGGTSGGGGPVLARALKNEFSNMRIIVVLVVPKKSEGRDRLDNLYEIWYVLKDLCDDGVINNIVLFENDENVPSQNPTQRVYYALNWTFVRRWQLVFGQGMGALPFDPKDIEIVLDDGRGLCLINSDEEEIGEVKGEYEISKKGERIVSCLRTALSRYDSLTLQSVKRGLLMARSDKDFLTHQALVRALKVFEKECKKAKVKSAEWAVGDSKNVEVGILLTGIEKYPKLEALLESVEKWNKDKQKDVQDALNEIRNMEF